jgi:hypothetical protein
VLYKLLPPVIKPQQSPRICLSGQIAPLVASAIGAEEIEGYFYQSSLKSPSLDGGAHSRDFSLLGDESESSEEFVTLSLGLLNFSSCPVLIGEDDTEQREVTLEHDCYTLGRNSQKAKPILKPPEPLAPSKTRGALHSY